MWDISKLNQLLLSNFPYEPTLQQKELLQAIANFLLVKENYKLFVLTGYAGTGKTTVLSALTQSFTQVKKPCILLAPTGRAAKVMSAYTGKPAWTIHKKIYSISSENDEKIGLSLQVNKHKNTIFIVDEASMIPDYADAQTDAAWGRSSLLADLIEYIYSGEHCFAIFCGDNAQLPPVNRAESPAINVSFLQKNFDLTIHHHEITEVLRQSKDSGILSNATAIRKIIHKGKFMLPKFQLKNFDDIIKISGEELPDALNMAYSSVGIEDTIVITSSNKRANLFNQSIRQRLLFMEEAINTGDYIMMVKNNYYWMPQNGLKGFIANGDAAEVMRIRKIENLYGFTFADVELRLFDYPKQPTIEAKVILDSLTSESPALTAQQQKELFYQVSLDYQDILDKKVRYLKMLQNPYLNALQIKFAYAVTCHKAQGGQWKQVFVDQGIVKKENMNFEYLRWLYTAMTRAIAKLFLVNFDESFFQK